MATERYDSYFSGMKATLSLPLLPNVSHSSRFTPPTCHQMNPYSLITVFRQESVVFRSFTCNEKRINSELVKVNYLIKNAIRYICLFASSTTARPAEFTALRQIRDNNSFSRSPRLLSPWSVLSPSESLFRVLAFNHNYYNSGSSMADVTNVMKCKKNERELNNQN